MSNYFIINKIVHKRNPGYHFLVQLYIAQLDFLKPALMLILHFLAFPFFLFIFMQTSDKLGKFFD